MTITSAETVEGVVESRNERGIRVAGEWRNVSKFRPLELPAVGDPVRLGLDAKGFITTLEVLNEFRSESGQNSRDDRIARLAVLKAAAAFGASRPDLKSADVLAIAERWLEWILA